MNNLKLQLLVFQWSFGVTLWEIFTDGSTPYFDCENAAVVQGVQQGDLRLDTPRGFKIME